VLGVNSPESALDLLGKLAQKDIQTLPTSEEVVERGVFDRRGFLLPNQFYRIFYGKDLTVSAL
jgi:hypothetical protein